MELSRKGWGNVSFPLGKYDLALKKDILPPATRGVERMTPPREDPQEGPQQRAAPRRLWAEHGGGSCVVGVDLGCSG